MSVKSSYAPACNKSLKHRVVLVVGKGNCGGEILFELRYLTQSKRLRPAAVPVLYIKGTPSRLPLQDISGHVNINDNVNQSQTTISSLRHLTDATLVQPAALTFGLYFAILQKRWN